MVGGKQRRYYRATPAGGAALATDPIVERAARAQQGVPAQEGGRVHEVSHGSLHRVRSARRLRDCGVCIVPADPGHDVFARFAWRWQGRQVRGRSPHTQVVVLSGYSDDARVMAALRAGAIGYVRKEAEPEVLLAAVRAAARRQSSLDPALAQTVVQELAPAPAVARPHHSRAATSRAARKPLAMA